MQDIILHYPKGLICNHKSTSKREAGESELRVVGNVKMEARR